MTVSNMERSVAFFSNVLTFEKVSDEEVAGSEYEKLQGVFGLRMRIVRMRLGGEEIELTEYLAPRGRPVPADSRSNDRWFQHVAIIVSDMDAAYARLRQHGVEHASPEPQRLPDWNPEAGGIKAFYFKDPDGHPLEILEFPAGKGRSEVARAEPAAVPWHRPHRDRRRRYRDEPDTSTGTFWAFASLVRATNYGPEQERLNNVFGARLHITALRAPPVRASSSWSISPRNGRPAAGIQANDLAHWETTITTADSSQAFEQFLRQRVFLVSPGVGGPAGDAAYSKGHPGARPRRTSSEGIER